jgi:hypothetical protein
MVWKRVLMGTEPPAWAPAAVGIASLVAVLFLWRAIATREKEQVLALSIQAAEAERRALVLEITATSRTFGRMAEAVKSGTRVDQQRDGFVRLRRDLTGLEGGVRLDAKGNPLLVVPEQLLDIGPMLVTWGEYLRTHPGPPDSIVYLPLDPGVRSFAVIAPVCTQGQCDGAVAGIMRSSALFSETFSDSTRGFRYGIIGPRGRIGGSPVPNAGSDPWSGRVPLEIGDAAWSLVAWPTEVTLERLRSSLPAILLFMGLIVSMLLPVTLGLARNAWRHSRETERARIAAALERATDGIWEWDVERGTVVRSSNLWRYLRYDPALVNTEMEAWSALIHPQDRAAVDRALRQHIDGQSDRYEAEYRVCGAEGEWHTIVDRGRVVEWAPDGEPRRVLGISADVTEARHAAEAREASERRFRAIFDSGFQFQLLLAADGTILEVNQAALLHAGGAPDGVRGVPVWTTLWWKDRPEAQARLREAMTVAVGGGTWHYEEDLVDESGEGALLELAVKPIKDPGGLAAQLLVEGRDISMRRRAEAALREVDTLATMGRVAARVAHEINNPLAGIQNSFLLIKDAVPPSHPHFPYVGAIEREIARIAGVTRQLYETYRPEQEETRETSLHMVVGDAVAFLEQVNRQSKVAVEVDLSRVAGSIPLPAAMLRQIVNNLVQNAVDASPAGGKVQVSAETSSRGLELRVRDHGPGIPVDIRERIFQPFFSTKDKGMRTGGMGLGLALVQRTVTAAGGRIVIKDGEGGGAEFVVHLPLPAQRNGGAG